MRYNTGVRILPAYEFSPGTIGHILLGYSYGKFKISDNGVYGYINTAIYKQVQYISGRAFADLYIQLGGKIILHSRDFSRHLQEGEQKHSLLKKRLNELALFLGVDPCRVFGGLDVHASYDAMLMR